MTDWRSQQIGVDADGNTITRCPVDDDLDFVDRMITKRTYLTVATGNRFQAERAQLDRKATPADRCRTIST